MIIIQLAGGLGNQMFQYALYLQLKALGRDIKIDDETGFVCDKQRKPALQVYHVTYETPSKREMIRMLDSSPMLWHRIRRKLFGRHKKAYFEEDKLFHPKVLQMDDIYLEGYWQTHKYFEGVADKVRECYDVMSMVAGIRQVAGPEIRNRYDAYYSQIKSCESVSVHVRRGDYLLSENVALFGHICDDTYYRKAVFMMKEKHPDAVFFLFTNDREWAKTGDALGDGVDYVTIQLPEDENRDCLEFALMSSCSHNILANSSFSWWASYLNDNPQKEVYAPDKWLNGWDCRDFYREDMTKISR